MVGRLKVKVDDFLIFDRMISYLYENELIEFKEII